MVAVSKVVLACSTSGLLQAAITLSVETNTIEMFLNSFRFTNRPVICRRQRSCDLPTTAVW